MTEPEDMDATALLARVHALEAELGAVLDHAGRLQAALAARTEARDAAVNALPILEAIAQGRRCAECGGANP